MARSHMLDPKGLAVVMNQKTQWIRYNRTSNQTLHSSVTNLVSFCPQQRLQGHCAMLPAEARTKRGEGAVKVKRPCRGSPSCADRGLRSLAAVRSRAALADHALKAPCETRGHLVTQIWRTATRTTEKPDVLPNPGEVHGGRQRSGSGTRSVVLQPACWDSQGASGSATWYNAFGWLLGRCACCAECCCITHGLADHAYDLQYKACHLLLTMSKHTTLRTRRCSR